MKLRVRKPEAVSYPTPQVPYPIGDELPNSCPQISQMNADKEQAGNNFPEFSQSRTKLWQRLLTLPPRRPKDRSPTWTPAGNLRSGRRRSGKTGWAIHFVAPTSACRGATFTGTGRAFGRKK